MKKSGTLLLEENNKRNKRKEQIFSCSALTDKGKTRATNEDSILLIEEEEGKILAGVFDGMGGMEKGEVASKMAADTVKKVFEEGVYTGGDFVRKALEEANSAVFRYSLSQGVQGLMGTTAVIALVNQDKMYYGNAGDSRLYVLRKGRLMQKTHDHSLVAYQLRNGIITKEEAERSNRKNVLIKAIGIKKGEVPEMYPPEVLTKGDVVLLCSDGLYNMVSEGFIKKILGLQKPINEKAQMLINAANRNGGKDNISVVLIEHNADRRPSRAKFWIVLIGVLLIAAAILVWKFFPAFSKGGK